MQKKNIPGEKLVDGFPTSLEYLLSPRNRIDWNLYIRLVERFTELYGGETALSQISELSDRNAVAGLMPTQSFIQSFARSVASARQLYWMVARYGGPANFDCLTAEMEDLPEGKIRISVILKEEYSGGEPLFRLNVPIFSLIPTVIGLPKTQVSATITSNRADYIVNLPPSMTLWARGSRKLQWLIRGEKAYYDELQYQLSELREVNASLESKVHERTRDLVAANEKKLHAERTSREKDLQLTAAVQRYFLPKQDRFEAKGITLLSSYEPAAHCGGDWWWVDEREDGKVLVLIGDVTGHGPGPAMVMAAFCNGYRLMRATGDGPANDPKAMFETLSQSLWNSCGGDYLISLAALELDPKHGTASLWSAGAPPVFFFNEFGDIETISVLGTPLGLKDTSIGFWTGPFRASDRFFLFTDGLMDIHRQGNAQSTLGLRKLRDILRAVDPQSLDQARTEVRRKLADYRGDSPLHDDVTFVWVGGASHHTTITQ